jgi:cell division cycle protein 37
LDDKERIKLELERDEIQQQEDKFRQKEKELEDKERLQPWNVDTIGREAWSKSIINKPKEQNEEAPRTSKPYEEEEHKKTLKYFEENDKLLKKLCLLNGFDRLEEFLQENPHLASEYATNWMTIEALNYAIEEDVGFEY